MENRTKRQSKCQKLVGILHDVVSSVKLGQEHFIEVEEGKNRSSSFHAFQLSSEFKSFLFLFKNFPVGKHGRTDR